MYVKTIKSYFVSLRSAHLDMGYDDLDVIHHPILKRSLAGVRRFRGEPDTQERCPLIKDVLLKVLTCFDQSTLFGATMQASFCLAFADFLRIGEFTWSSSDLSESFDKFFITRRSVNSYEDYLELTLPASKN